VLQACTCLLVNLQVLIASNSSACLLAFLFACLQVAEPTRVETPPPQQQQQQHALVVQAELQWEPCRPQQQQQQQQQMWLQQSQALKQCRGGRRLTTHPEVSTTITARRCR
jgi:hypothetical protein